MAFTQAHPRSGRTNIHYVAYRAGSLRRADGSVITSMANLPITPAQAELVYSWRTNGKAWVHDVALDDAGHPVIVYATFPTDTDHRYRYARWNGSGWTDRAGPGRALDEHRRLEPNHSGGITLDHETPPPSICPGRSPGCSRPRVWTTPDEGDLVVAGPDLGVGPGQLPADLPRGQTGATTWSGCTATTTSTSPATGPGCGPRS